MVEENRSSIIVSAHHYVLEDTTVASGEWEGMQRDNNGKWTPLGGGTLERTQKLVADIHRGQR